MGSRPCSDARTTFNASYASQWIDFERPDEEPGPLAPGLNLLRGGHSHGAIGELRHQFTRRFTLGGDYQAQRAIVAGGAETFDVQSALVVSEIALKPSVSASFGYGYAWLTAGRDSLRDSGPAVNAGLDWRGRHSSGGLQLHADLPARRSASAARSRTRSCAPR